jgi:succinoglycan biosynthesis protein ExoW
MITVAVIIPYFQKRAGILRRALSSVLQQSLPPDVRIDVIVVDDGSPVPARTEVEGLNFVSPYHLNVIEQPNGGVSIARNTGLGSVGDETTYIAFLDSDDIWGPEHVQTAIYALNLGLDYYFCNNRRVGSHDSYFLLTAFDPPSSAVSTLSAAKELYEINKEVFVGISLRTWISLTPTIIYRRSIAPDLLFNAALYPTGEDCLFFMQLISKSGRICYSSKIEVTLADGVNIWHSRYGWDSPTHTASRLCQVLSEQGIKKSLSLSKDDEQYIIRKITKLRRFFAYLTVRELIKKRKLLSIGIIKMTRIDPAFWIWYPLCVLYVVICFPLRLYTPPND